MRRVDEIVLHCSATREGQDIQPSTIRDWHLRRGFRDIGYHYIVTLDGTIHAGRSIDEVGAHVRGRNMSTIGICYVGGLDADGKAANTMTDAQRVAIDCICRALVVVLDRPLEITGHNEHSAKACPSFNVEDEFGDLVESCRHYR